MDNKIKYNYIKLIIAGLAFLIGIGQILLIIFNNKVFSNGTWYLFAVAWFGLGAYFIVSYFKKKKEYEETQKYIQEQEDALYHRKKSQQ